MTPCRRFIEVCGWFGEIRTHGEIFTEEVGSLTCALFFHFAQFIEENFTKLGIQDCDREYEAFYIDEYMTSTKKKHKQFLLNAMSAEVVRRQCEGPLRFNSVVIPMKTLDLKPRT